MVTPESAAVTVPLVLVGRTVAMAAVGATLSVAVLNLNTVGAAGSAGGTGGSGMQPPGQLIQVPL